MLWRLQFCALTFHQGRVVQVRSHESIIEEAKQMIEDPQFKGYIHDVGGPTANFRRTACDKQKNMASVPVSSVCSQNLAITLLQHMMII